jgi:hypothetical protein
MLAIRHKSLCSILSPCDVYLWDPSPSDMWDPMAYVSHVPMGPFSISIWPVGPDGLRVTCAYGPFSIRLVGPDGIFLYLHPTCGARRHLSPSPSDLWDLTVCVSHVPVGPSDLLGPDDLRVTCTYGTFLHLHPTCGTWRLACHLLPSGFNKFKLKKDHETWELNPRPIARNRPSSPLS